MSTSGRPGLGSKRILVLGLATLIYLTVGAAMGQWYARRMQDDTLRQFNEQQLALCRLLAIALARELGNLEGDLLALARNLDPALPAGEANQRLLQAGLARGLERGVQDLRLAEIDPRDEASSGAGPPAALPPGVVWRSEPEYLPTGGRLLLAAALPGGPGVHLWAEVNLAWFLGPLLRDARSGQSGYVWLLDGRGHFLYHPNADLVGEDAFVARARRQPEIAYHQIDAIQRERMLKGEEGIGEYVSGWHRGLTGPVRKLIAFHPVTLGGEPPQSWSLAVVAPAAEAEGPVREGRRRIFWSVALILLVIASSGGGLVFLLLRRNHALTRQAEEGAARLKRAEEQYRSLVESAEDFIFTFDPEGRITAINTFSAQFFGRAPGGFVGRPLAELLPAPLAEKLTALGGRVIREGKSLRHEMELWQAGEPVWLAANLMPKRDENGQVGAVLCIARDVTGSKLLERQLINAEKLASLGTLAAGVAHEVNNPLGVILGFCGLLLKKTDKTSQDYEDLKIIERQGLHCKRVVENLLSFVRAGKRISEYTDVVACLQEVIGIVQHSLEVAGVRLEAALPAELPPVRGDLSQLQQVFLNLINNALAAMPQGGTLRLRAFRDRVADRVVTRIRDTGVGIPPEHLDRIFEPFFTTKPEGQGTGLGLFVSYGIVSRFGGSLSVESRVARRPGDMSGSTFIVRLPCRPDAPDPSA